MWGQAQSAAASPSCLPSPSQRTAMWAGQRCGTAGWRRFIPQERTLGCDHDVSVWSVPWCTFPLKRFQQLFSAINEYLELNEQKSMEGAMELKYIHIYRACECHASGLKDPEHILLFSHPSAVGKRHSPFSRASICSWVKDVLFLCSFLFNWSLIWASSESSPLELMEFVFSPPPSCCGQPSRERRVGK